MQLHWTVGADEVACMYTQFLQLYFLCIIVLYNTIIHRKYNNMQ